jgi:hypothetical protein
MYAAGDTRTPPSTGRQSGFVIRSQQVFDRALGVVDLRVRRQNNQYAVMTHGIISTPMPTRGGAAGEDCRLMNANNAPARSGAKGARAMAASAAVKRGGD